MNQPKKQDDVLVLIAIFKLIKGIILIILGISLITFFNDDHVAKIQNWIYLRDIAPSIIDSVFDKIDFVVDHKKMIGYGAIFYSIFFFIEGIGLLAKKKWAEYFTLIVTSSLVPFEIYELVKEVSITKLIVVFINTAIVYYLYKKVFSEK